MLPLTVWSSAEQMRCELTADQRCYTAGSPKTWCCGLTHDAVLFACSHLAWLDCQRMAVAQGDTRCCRVILSLCELESPQSCIFFAWASGLVFHASGVSVRMTQREEHNRAACLLLQKYRLLLIGRSPKVHSAAMLGGLCRPPPAPGKWPHGGRGWCHTGAGWKI